MKRVWQSVDGKIVDQLMKQVWQSVDGKIFEHAEDCASHESMMGIELFDGNGEEMRGVSAFDEA